MKVFLQIQNFIQAIISKSYYFRPTYFQLLNVYKGKTCLVLYLTIVDDMSSE